MWPAHRASARQGLVLLERDWDQMLERRLRILQGIERQRRFVFREAVAVGEFGVFFLQVPGVGEEDRA